MSQPPTEEFLTLEFFKEMVKSTDTQDDIQYTQFVDDANLKVTSAISRYIDTPIGETSEFFTRCRAAALAFARSLQSEDIEQLEKAANYLSKHNIELYGEKGTQRHPNVGGLIQDIISTRNNKTITVLARFDPRNFKVPLPTQNDLFVSQRFG